VALAGAERGDRGSSRAACGTDFHERGAHWADDRATSADISAIDGQDDAVLRDGGAGWRDMSAVVVNCVANIQQSGTIDANCDAIMVNSDVGVAEAGARSRLLDALLRCRGAK
jgi:hypothetical protein